MKSICIGFWALALSSLATSLSPIRAAAQAHTPTSGQLASQAYAKYYAASEPTSNAANAFSLTSNGAARTLHILAGQSLVMHGDGPILRVYVGNPSVLQSFTASPHEIVLTAKTPGISSLVVWNSDGQSCLYTVSSDIDPSVLRRSLAQAFPASEIQADGVENRIVLSGAVPTPEIADGAYKLASVYSKDIASSIRVVPVHGKQVQLKLRILEVDRTRLDQLGVNLSYTGKNNTASTSALQFTNPLNLSFYNAKTGIGVQVQDLVQHQAVQILAEPTLTTISGQTAHFLSGGEFPVPVAQGIGGSSNSTAITIQFKPYGVKVEFTPTVNPDGTIHLKIAPEVSTLDYTNEVTISGFTIPALSTRRAESEVELRDGESFVLSGLLDRRTTDLLASVPGISNIPILGELFRSKNNTHSVVELVLMVQVTVVDPLTSPGDLHEPHWAVPNLDVPAHDQQINSQLHSKKAAPGNSP
jgi:pilus assembly protein CpaC